MKAILTSIRDLAPEARHFDFEIPELEAFNFKPGQFVSFTHLLNGKKITRPYSICTVPDGNRFSLCLNIVHVGLFSPHLFTMKPGDWLEMQGPYGNFVVRNPQREMIFVATGTGIAPFRGMIAHQLGVGLPTRVTLIFGARYHANLLYLDELEALASTHSNFDLRPTLSRPGPDWTGRTGHVQPHVMEFIGEQRDFDIYICGLKAMVDDLRERLKAMGFDRKQIIFEKYD